MRRLFAAFLVLPAVLGCQKVDDHPANLGSCESSTNCSKPPIGGGGGGDASVGLDGATNDDAGLAIGGAILVLTDDDFSAGIPLPGLATVSVEGESGLSVTGNYDGAAYSVSGVKIGNPVWATVEPQPADGLPTAQPLNTEGATSFDLVAVQGATLDLIYGILPTLLERDPLLSQVVLRFVDEAGDPIPGVLVEHQGEVVVYDAGGTWTDDALGTGDQGFAIVSNVTPGSSPSKQTFSFTVNGVTSGAELWVAAETVTITDVLVLP
jgi:hypothetical protein